MSTATLNPRIAAIQRRMQTLRQSSAALTDRQMQQLITILDRFCDDLDGFQTNIEYPKQDQELSKPSQTLPLNPRYRQERLYRLQTELDRMERFSTLEKTARKFAHQLSQPLMVIMTYAQNCLRLLQADREPNENIIHALTKIVEQGKKTGEIIRNLKQNIPHDDLLMGEDMNDFISEVVNLIAPQAGTHAINLQLEFAEEALPVSVAAVQIRQVLLDLLYSAIAILKKSRGERQIILQTIAATDNTVELSVSIHPSALVVEGVDQPVESPLNIPDFWSSNLVLPESRAIVENHGGQLWTTVSEQGNVTFHMNLPLHREK